MPDHSRGRFITLSAAAGIAYGLGTRGKASAQTPSVTPLRLGSTSSDDAVSAVYALKAGLFAKAGLDVTIEKQNNGAVITAAVAGGTFDLGKTSLPSLVQARDRGISFVVVAPGALYDTRSPYSVELVLRNSPIHTGKDANNLTFCASSLMDIGDIAMRAWVDQNGGDSRTLRMVEIPFPAVAAAVEQGRVAGGVLTQPNLANAMATGKFRYLKTGDAIAPRYYITVWFATKDYASKNPDVIRAFSRVIAQSATYTNAHPAETAPMMAEYTSVPVEKFQTMARAIEGSIVDPDLMQPLIETMVKYGLTKSTFPARDMIDADAATR